MITFQDSPEGVRALNTTLRQVDTGLYYLRVKSQNGKLTYDKVAKADTFFGRIVQYITRLFDSSYNIQNGAKLIFKKLEDAPETGLEKLTAQNTLVNIVRHVNEKRWLTKVDIPQDLRTAAKTERVTAALFPAYKKLATVLSAWAEKGSPDENRAEAALRILENIKDKSPALILTSLNLTELPQEITQLPHLKELYLDENQLARLPDNLGDLTALTLLSLRENKLTNLPESLKNLTSLREIEVAYNPLEGLPEAVCNLPNLKNIVIDKDQEKLIPLAAKDKEIMTAPRL